MKCHKLWSPKSKRSFFITPMLALSAIIYFVVSVYSLNTSRHEICSDGFLFEDTLGPTVCCPHSCGACTYNKCSSRPGGYNRCCERGIVDSLRTCIKPTDVACIVRNVDIMRLQKFLRPAELIVRQKNILEKNQRKGDQGGSRRLPGKKMGPGSLLLNACRTAQENQTLVLGISNQNEECEKKLKIIKYEVTVISTFTSERIGHVLNLLRTWKGKLVLTFYVKRGESDSVVPSELKDNDRVTLIYFRWNDKHTYFPVNDVRQVALEAVTTTHFFLIDVDLIPSTNMYEYIHCQLPQSLLAQNDAVHVVPAFETNERGIVKKLDKCWLALCLEQQRCDQFHANNYREHSSTQYWKWWKSNSDVPSDNDYRYKIDCISHEKFEPYVIVPKKKGIMFDGRFQGFGKNKLQFITLLRYQGYKFYVLHALFLLHLFHTKSAAQKEWNHSTRGQESCRTDEGGMRQKNDELFATTLLEYSAKYGKDSHQLCSNTKVFSSCTCDCVKLVEKLKNQRADLNVWET